MKDDEKKLAPVQPSAIINPDDQVAFGKKCADALIKIINSKPKKVMINGEQYIEFEDWQTIARFFNTTVGTEKTTRIEVNGEFKGYEAIAVVFNAQGLKIGSAEASCLRDEAKWNTRSKFEYQNNRRVKIGDELVPEFQLKSMAQTRACAKALRNIFSWVVVLAGYKTTPAEELDAEAKIIKAENGKDNGRITEAQIGKITDNLFLLNRDLGELEKLMNRPINEWSYKEAEDWIKKLDIKIQETDNPIKPKAKSEEELNKGINERIEKAKNYGKRKEG